MKDIIIAKNGAEESLSGVKKLSTATLEGGSCNWVPEDEANDYASFGTLLANENGTFAPEDQAGYNSVTVNVPPEYTLGGSKYITENGVYPASEDQVTGYAGAIVSIPSGANLGFGFASENGAYNPADDGFDGYSSFRAEVISQTIDDGAGTETIIEIDDPTDPEIYDISKIGEIEGVYSVDPISGISSIATIDPLTGTLTGDVISVDTEGNVTTSTIPVSMSITTPPTKTSYTEGEVIDYRGIVCTLYNKDGTVFTNERYPDGTVPMSELEYPVSLAPAGSGGGGSSSTLDTSPANQPIPVYSSVSYYQINSNTGKKTAQYDYTADYVSVYVDTQGKPAVLCASSQNGTYTSRYRQWNGDTLIVDQTRQSAFLSSVTYGGKTAYYTEISPQNSGWTIQEQTITPQNINPNKSATNNIVWTMVYGEIGGTASIPVLWPNNLTDLSDVFPVKLKFRDTFEIEVTNDE